MRSVEEQKELIKNISNDKIKIEKALRIIRYSTLYTQSDKVEYEYILFTGSIKSYWNMDTLARDNFIDVLEKCK